MPDFPFTAHPGLPYGAVGGKAGGSVGELSLLDVARPYFFVGMDLGPGVHDVLELLHVDAHDVAWDDEGVVITGVARIDSSDPFSPLFSPFAGGNKPDPDAKTPVWTFHDISIGFRLTAARQPGAALDATTLTDPALRTAIAVLGSATPATRSDAPGTQFRLDLLFQLVSVTIPKLKGGKLAGTLLVPDPANPTVRLDLPRILLVLTQDSAAETDFDVRLGSWGAETLDDADPAIASLIRMEPTYAIVNEHFGFGFEKAVLDLSGTKTPPDLLEHFGIGDDFQGVYLPEIRIFATTQKSAGTAFNVGARECIIGLNNPDDIEVWGDFNIDVDFLGERLDVALRLYGVSGSSHDPAPVERPEGVPADVDFYQITVPAGAGPETENYLLYLDIRSGSAPFAITAVAGEDHPADLSEFPDDAFFDDPSNSPEDISVLQRVRIFSTDQRVAIRVRSASPLQRRIILLDIYPDPLARASTVAEATPNKHKLAKLIPDQPAKTSRVRKVREDGLDVLLELTPPDGALSVNGSVVTVTDGIARVPVAEDAELDVDVVWTTSGEKVLAQVHGYFKKDEPKAGATTDAPMSASPITGAAVTPVDTTVFKRAFDERATGSSAPPAIVRVDGYASREADLNVKHNQPLSGRRVAQLARRIAADLGIPLTQINQRGWGEDLHPLAPPEGEQQPQPGEERLVRGHVPGDTSADAAASDRATYRPEEFRLAVASLLAPTSGTDSFAGRLVREKREPDKQPPLVPAPRPPQSTQPDFLRSLGGTIRLERDRVAAFELRLSVDFQTAHEDGLEQFRDDIDTMRPGLESAEEARLPDGPPNPQDGIVDFRYTVIHDLATGGYAHTLVGRAAAGDVDGLWSWGQIPASTTTGEPDTEPWRDLLGLYFALAPLAAPTPSEEPPDGSVVPLVVALTTPLVVTVLGIAHVLRITHYGVELVVRHDEDEVRGALLFDVENAIWLDVRIGSFEILTTRPDKPIKLRYKAVGFSLDAVEGQPVRFSPAFDSSRGYTIDLADSGSLRVLPSLGDAGDDLIQILGARIARTNPLNLEVDLGLGVDLGVFTVDTFGVRLPLDPAGPPTITAIGVGVDVPGAITGSGYLQIFDNGFAGQLDLQLPSVGLRIAGGLRAGTVTEGDRSAFGVVATLEAEYPGGIPLGGTGLAIFGFSGLFAMHHRRLENPAARIPALDWLVNVAQGNPTRIQAWGPALDAWAFGIGLVAGTIEGGTILNLKGMLILELPGPRVLLLAGANLVKKRPPTKGTETGNLFAVVDVSPQRVLIGLQIDYEISHVLDLHIPADAGFFLEPPDRFFLNVGTIAHPATAKVLEVFDATAYLQVHGQGIPDFPLVAGGLQGFSMATGFRLSLVWGNTDVGLYVRATSGFDAGVGFAPFRFAGRMFLDGELRLFIVSLEVHASLDLDSDGEDTRISGEVCGKVSFFFFSVKGCVDFTLGDVPGAPFPALPIRDLALQSRSPALVEGTATDRGVDTVLCRGTADGSVPVVDDGEGGLRQVFVPIDAIPLLQLEVAPVMAASAVDGVLSGGLPAGAGDGWQQRGPNFLRYSISAVELRLVRLNGAAPPQGLAPTTEGPRPYTWRRGPQPAGGDCLPVDLAILDWKPTNVDKAMLEGPALDAVVDGTWGKVCDPVAVPAAVLWTFRASPLGPSEAGWLLDGEAWPDPPGAQRSRAVDTHVRVVETWRSGTLLDGLAPHAPAEVVGVGVPCPPRPGGPGGRPPVFGGDGEVFDPRRGDVAPPPTRRPPLALRDDVVALRAGALAPADSEGVPTPPPPPPPPPIRTEPGITLRPLAATNPRQCLAKVLQAPYEQLADLLDGGILTGPLMEALRALDELRAEELRDVVRVSGGPFVQVRLLILARAKMVEKDLIRVRAVAAGGKEIQGTSATFTLITTAAQLPGPWRDATGPWEDDVTLARAYAATGVVRELAEYLVTVELPEPAVDVDIGVSPLVTAVNDFDMAPPSYLVAVIEALSLAEVDRAEDDAESADGDAGGLTGTLTGQGHALLRPGGEYRVTVRYDAEVGARRAHPEEDEDPNEIVVLRSVTGQVDTRTFFTDAQPPRSLDPWLLAQQPADGERFHFYDEPVVVVFATDDVLELFAAYNRTLRAVARAASFRGSAGTPEEAGTILDLEAVFTPLGTVVLSPWEATVRRLLGELPCVGDPDSDTHGRAVLPLVLDPRTDYVLDIEALLPNGTRPPVAPLPGEVGTRPLYRRSLTTGRYATREALAADVRIARQRSQAVPDPAPLATLATTAAGVVSDEEMDTALRDAGLEVGVTPDEPIIAKLWTPGSPAVLLAVLIHSPEPLWRTRSEPTPEYDEGGEHILRWRLQPAQWLGVDELVPDGATPVSDGGTFVQATRGVMITLAPTLPQARRTALRRPPPLPLPPPPVAALVTRLTHDASGTRTLAFLAADAVGKTLTLGLQRTLNPLLDTDASDTPLVLAEIPLAPPPWEVAP